MKVELLHFEGCPNWTRTDERLTEALMTLGRDDVTVERRQVETTTQAEEFGFTDSPTIRVDSRDAFATGERRVGLASRVYSTPEGLSGSPTVEQMVVVLS